MSRFRIIHLFGSLLILALAILLTANNFPAQIRAAPQEPQVSEAKRRKAEQIVVRALRRFGQTLDFKTVYREMFVRNKLIRRREDTPLLKGFIDERIANELDQVKLEQAFVGSQNLYWMFMVHSLQRNGRDIKLIEREISPQLNEKQRVIYERILSDDEDYSIKSRTEIADCLAVYEEMSTALRQEISPALKEGLQNRIKARIISSKSISNGEIHTSRYKTVFKVGAKMNNEPVPFSFIVVEQNGTLKILSVSISD